MHSEAPVYYLLVLYTDTFHKRCGITIPNQKPGI